MRNDSLSYYYLGGGIPADRDAYVERNIDSEVYEFLTNPSDKRFCHIVAARQMGKTSLMKRLIKKIHTEICIEINIQGFGTINVNDEKILYNTILNRIYNQLPEDIINEDLKKKISNIVGDSSIAPGSAFQDGLQFILEKISSKKLIIFLDEIQCLFDWELQNSFFGVLKTIAEKDDMLWKRINIVLLGVINPNDLLTSSSYAVNHYQSFEMTNLSGSCEPLWSGLKKVTNTPEKVIQSILKYTGGKPFLTQYFCDCIVRESLNKTLEINNNQNLDTFINKIIIRELKQKDPQNHLQSIKNFFYNSRKIKKIKKALNLYKIQLISKQPITFDNSYEHKELIISGLSIRDGSNITIACPIYKKIFDNDWVERTIQILNQKLGEDMREELEEREYLIIIDRSASMNTPDQKGEKTRWEAIQEFVKGSFWEIKKIKNIEISIYVFASSFKRFDQIQDYSKLELIFQEYAPVLGGTNLSDTLQDALNNYFELKQKGKAKKNGLIALVITDGQPDDENAVFNVIIEASKKIERDEELGLSFIKVGSDRNAEKFLKKIDNHLKELGAKYDICDTISFEEVQKIEDITELLNKAIND